MVNRASEIRTKLEETIGAVVYSDLKAHIARGGLLLVDSALPLIDVGVAIASDDAAAVGRWIEEGRLRRPNENELATWTGNSERRWLAIVIQPYVLVQDID